VVAGKSPPIFVRGGGGQHLDGSSGGLIVDTVEVEDEQSGVRPFGANIDDMVEASVSESNRGGRLRISNGG